MSPARPSQTYRCQSKGCTSGGTFEAAPEEWFRAKSLTPPRQCPACREWCRSQIDESIECVSCRWSLPISAKRKISFHKREGAWRAPDQCSRCLLDPQDSKEREAAKKSRARKPLLEPQVGVSAMQRMLAERGLLSGFSGSYDVGATEDWWMGVQPSFRRRFDPAYNHVIVRHGVEIGNAAKITDISMVIPYLSELSRSTDSRRFVEFRQQNPAGVVKLDVETGVAIMLELNTHIPITAFTPSVTNVMNKLDAKNTNDVRWLRL